MSICRVTVEGRTLEVQARSLCMAAIKYNAAQICGHSRHYPRLQPDTVLSVLTAGESEPRLITWKQVLDWANRKTEADSRRWLTHEAEKESQGKR
jgi:hypothetical protein